MDLVENRSIIIEKCPWTCAITGGPWTWSMKVVGPKQGSMDPWSMFPPHPLYLPSYTHDSCVSMKWIRWSISWLLRSTGQCGLWTWGLACINSIKFMENFPYSNFCLGSVYSIMCEIFLAGHKEVFLSPSSRLVKSYQPELLPSAFVFSQISNETPCDLMVGKSFYDVAVLLVSFSLVEIVLFCLTQLLLWPDF